MLRFLFVDHPRITGAVSLAIVMLFYRRLLEYVIDNYGHVGFAVWMIIGFALVCWLHSLERRRDFHE